MGCNCNDSSSATNTKSDCSSCKFTGDLSYDGADFECDIGTEETPNVVFSFASGLKFNTMLNTIFTLLCSLSGMSIENVGTGAKWFKEQVGYKFNFRTLTSTDNSVTIVENTDTIDLSIAIGPKVLACTTERLGAAEGGTSLPGNTIIGTSYTVPSGAFGKLTGFLLFEIYVLIARFFL